MNGKEGYMAVNHGEDMLNGWHGGPCHASDGIGLFPDFCYDVTDKETKSYAKEMPSI
jgi:hypothetical protein